MKGYRWGCLVVGGALLLTTGCAVGRMPHDMEAQIQGAQTKADHEALATHYEAEAKRLQDKATEHERLARVYARGIRYRGRGNILVERCEFLVSKYREAAGETLGLAKVHRQLAEEAPK